MNLLASGHLTLQPNYKNNKKVGPDKQNILTNARKENRASVAWSGFINFLILGPFFLISEFYHFICISIARVKIVVRAPPTTHNLTLVTYEYIYCGSVSQQGNTCFKNTHAV